MTQSKDRGSGGFGLISASWFRNPKLGVNEIAVLAAMAIRAKGGHCYVSQSTIGRDVGRSRVSVCRTIGVLVEVGVLVKAAYERADGATSANSYYLVGEGHFATLEDAHRASLQHCLAPVRKGARPDGLPVLQRNRGCIEDEHRIEQTDLNEKTDSPRDASVDENPSEMELAAEPPVEPAAAEPAAAPSPSTSQFQEVPADWTPSDEDITWAVDAVPHAVEHLAEHARRFVLRCRSKNYRYRDIGAAWRSWVLDDLRPTEQTPPPYARQGRGAPATIPKGSLGRKYRIWANLAQGRANAARAMH